MEFYILINSNFPNFGSCQALTAWFSTNEFYGIFMNFMGAGGGLWLFILYKNRKKDSSSFQSLEVKSLSGKIPVHSFLLLITDMQRNPFCNYLFPFSKLYFVIFHFRLTQLHRSKLCSMPSPWKLKQRKWEEYCGSTSFFSCGTVTGGHMPESYTCQKVTLRLHNHVGLRNQEKKCNVNP